MNKEVSEIINSLCILGTVVYHRDTKVMYVVSNDTYNRGTFTVLVDAQGRPMLWGGKIDD